jgi:hypothetical protein
MAADFPEPKWAVQGVICEGVNLIAGPPKVGKSWLSLGLGLSIAAGEPAFGSIATEAGPVLYLALEDTARRLQSRMGKLLAGKPAPHGLTLATECPPLADGGDRAITAGSTATQMPAWSSLTFWRRCAVKRAREAASTRLTMPLSVVSNGLQTATRGRASGDARPQGCR